MPRMLQSITRMNHHRELSIVRKHCQAVSEFYKYSNSTRENLRKLCSKTLGKQINRFVKIAHNSLNIFRQQLLRNELKRPYSPYMIENKPQIVEQREVHTQHEMISQKSQNSTYVNKSYIKEPKHIKNI